MLFTRYRRYIIVTDYNNNTLSKYITKVYKERFGKVFFTALTDTIISGIELSQQWIDGQKT